MGGNPAGAGLVVGGDLTMVGGQVFHGDVHVAGALNEISTVADGQVFNPSNIVDFASAQTQAIGLSLVLAGLPATGDVVLEDYGTLRLTGTDSSLNVFFIDDLTWKSAIEVKLYAPLGSRVIINVDVVTDDIPGDHPMFGEIWMNDSADPTAFQQTIWNFSKATSLSQWGVGWKGSLLAPWAHFTYENGMLAGQLIVKTVTMTEWSAETRRFPFICDPTPCEPDCVDKACGADGCGGVCGACPEDEFCDTGICFPSCVPDCTDKACGADGCGGLCGVCLPGESCDAEVCVPTGCVPDCAGKGCGLDGCGGTCGVCAVDEACLKGGCTPGAGVCANLHLGPAKDFNLFALEGLVHIGGDTEGAVASGGDASLQQFGIGLGLPAGGNAFGAGLVVGGDLDMVGGTVVHGDVHVGGAVVSVGAISDGALLNPSAPVDFAYASGYLTWFSNVLASYYTANGDAAVDGIGRLTLTGVDPYINTFLLSEAEWKATTEVAIEVPVGSTCIISVMVYSDDINLDHPTPFGGMWMNGSADPADFAKVLWNFPQATDLSFSAMGWMGSILCPNADFIYENGNINGHLIAKTVSMTEWSAECHDFPFTGFICGP